MPEFPDNIFTPRETENLPGLVYDENDKRNMYSEDFQNLGLEIKAIEETLGINPEGAYATVKERLDDIAGAGPVELLYSNIGDSSIDGPYICDSFAVSGLAEKDRLLVYFTFQVKGNTVEGVSLWNDDDSKRFCYINQNINISSGEIYSGHAILSADGLEPEYIDTLSLCRLAGSTGDASFFERVGFPFYWMDPFTLSLRYNNLIAGATFNWNWSIYKLKGQD